MNENRINVLSENMLPEMQDESYTLRAKVKIVKQTLCDVDSLGNKKTYESKWVILELEQNNQFVKFLQAYFPDDIIDAECEVLFAHCRQGFDFRASVSRPDKNSDKIHLKMMSIDHEERFKQGEVIYIQSLTRDEEQKSAF